MLVLSRKINETILIDDNIVVTILDCEGDKVKIGISAPKEVSIYRQELWEAMAAQDSIAEKLANGDEPESFRILRRLLAEEITGDEEPSNNGDGDLEGEWDDASE